MGDSFPFFVPDRSSLADRRVAAQLEQHGHVEIKLVAEVELFLRISNSDVLSSIECTEFLVRVTADENDLHAVASNEKDWGMAWERGIEPIKQATLQDMRTDVWNLDETLAEDSYTFQAAMVLLASELVGPYVDRMFRQKHQMQRCSHARIGLRLQRLQEVF